MNTNLSDSATTIVGYTPRPLCSMEKALMAACSDRSLDAAKHFVESWLRSRIAITEASRGIAIVETAVTEWLVALLTLLEECWTRKHSPFAIVEEIRGKLIAVNLL